MRRGRVGVVAAAAVVLLGLAGPATASAPAVTAARPRIAATYAAPGPAGRAVTRIDVVDGQGARTHRIYLPRDLGPAGTRHPVVAWGNGSFEHPDKYEPLLRHLASWGFVVVAAETDQAGTGQEILAGIRRVLAADADPRSPLFGHVDHRDIGAVGHSQGAGGAVRAATDASGLVTTVVPIALPVSLYSLLGADHDYHLWHLRVPVLFLSGEADVLISPAGAVAGFYDEARGPAAMGILRGADHNTIQLDAGSGFRGVLTAWLRWQLADDARAGRAFAGPHPELAGDPAWRDVRRKDLGSPGASAPSAPSGTSTPSAPSAP